MLKRRIMPLLMVVTAFFLSGKMSSVLAATPFCDGYDGNTNNPQINTALGCVPVTVSGFIGWFLPKLFGIIGGISFLLIIYGFILIATSAGDPKKVQGARETITSAITGLMVSIFSLFILRLIAVNILHIPGIN